MSPKDGEEDIAAPYRSAVGSLMFAMVATRPDLAFSVSEVSRFMDKPGSEHWTQVKRILKYLSTTKKLQLSYDGKQPLEVIAYSDADWATEVDKQRSQTGCIITLCGGAISWKSQCQKTVALSTVEAEYMALATTIQEVIWIRNLLKELGFDTQTTTVYEDNMGAIAVSKNPEHHGRTKHIDVRYHFIRERIESSEISVTYCPTQLMTADMLTKGLPSQQLEKLSRLIGLFDPGEC